MICLSGSADADRASFALSARSPHGRAAGDLIQVKEYRCVALKKGRRLNRGVRDMKASDVMVWNVITVGPDACVQDVAELLLRHRISAVPVIGANGDILGIVSEGDLINRPESETSHRKSWWLDALASNETLAAEYVKSHSRKVADVMTRDVITASPDTSVAQVAALLDKNAIKRVPIVKNGKIVGIVSRANLLQGLAGLKDKTPQAGGDDSAIRDKVMERLQNERWTRPALISVTVQDATVDLWGIVETPAERKAVHVLAEVTPGVRAVNDNLMIRPTASEKWM
jgi:CBS domain-containing protein